MTEMVAVEGIEPFDKINLTTADAYRKIHFVHLRNWDSSPWLRAMRKEPL
jgi:hypothetical protein